MGWFKVDDLLWGGPKWLSVSARGRALWVTAGSWCAAMGTDGVVPTHVLATLGGRPRDAAELVNAKAGKEHGLWDEHPRGWIFHDWELFQPDAESEQARKDASHKAMSKGGKDGNHVRWHVGRKLIVPTCIYCNPDRVPDITPESPPNRVLSPRPDPVPDTWSSKHGIVGLVDAGARDDAMRVAR